MIYKFFKNVETVEELYSQYKKLAMLHHPDHGGRCEDMQQINAEYDDLKKRVGNTHKSATGETYQSESTDTNAPDRFRDIINAVINFNIDLELCGCWLWAFQCVFVQGRLKIARLLLLLQEKGVGLDGREPEEEQAQNDARRNPRYLRERNYQEAQGRNEKNNGGGLKPFPNKGD